MIELCAKQGYQAVSIAQLSSHAGVSSATFYEQFKDKEDCLLAAYREAAARVLAEMVAVEANSARPSAEWTRVAGTAVRRMLQVLEKEPNSGQVLFTAALAAGPRVLKERRRVLGEFEQRAQDFLDSTPKTIGKLDLPSVAVVGALRSIVSRRLRMHAEQELPSLANDLVLWVQAYARRSKKARWSTSPSALLKTPIRAQPPGGVPTPTRLPRGRHRLPPGIVARSRRTRIIYATAEVMLAKGYEDATVADIVAAAGVSRDVFYEHFTDKQQAFLEAQQQSTQDILDACAVAYFSAKDWPERVWRGLETLIAVIASHPALAHLRLVECYAVGPAAVRRAEEITRAFTIFLEEGYGYSPSAAAVPRLSSQAITGAIFEIIQRDIAAGQVADLPRQLPLLTYIAIAPFTGPEHAISLIDELKSRPARSSRPRAAANPAV
jgi:AcrR family transcriptional regulator